MVRVLDEQAEPTPEGLVDAVEAALRNWRRFRGIVMRMMDAAVRDHVPETVIADLSFIAGRENRDDPLLADEVLRLCADMLDGCAEAARQCINLGPAGQVVWRTMAVEMNCADHQDRERARQVALEAARVGLAQAARLRLAA